MKKVTSLLFLLLFLLVSPAFAQSQGITLQYTVSIPDPELGIAEISIDIQNIKSSNFVLETSELRGLFIDPIDLIAFDGNGNELAIAVGIDYENEWEGRSWTIDTGVADSISVRYSVSPNSLEIRNSMLHAYIESEFAFAEGQALFLVPENYNQYNMYQSISISKISVSFELPDEWQVFAPWENEGNEYFPGVYTGNMLTSLSFAPIALGGFNYYTEDITGTSYTAAVYSGWSDDEQHLIADHAINEFSY